MRFFVRLILSSILAALPLCVWGQTESEVRIEIDPMSLPDAPEPARALSANAVNSDALPATEQESSSSGASQARTDERKQSEDQLKLQEHQRVAGVMATFNTTTNRNAPPLSPRQKFALFFRGERDPWPFALAAAISGVGQADDSYPEWGQGLKGYAKRYGAAYSDSFIGNFFGNALLPALLKEDPRYFQMGTGSKKKRFWWAATSTIWCRRDSGSWGPNYANLAGNLIGAAISRAYYPDSERDVGSTISDGLTVSAEGIVGSEIIEFWPDLARALKKKHDAKQARKAAEADSPKERE
ncbi:MAG TPA: hypothetical protein VHZ28_00410 [Terracidiphilus sp.]|nr:hypothetical protein [Terracidiphilus sp.]